MKLHRHPAATSLVAAVALASILSGCQASQAKTTAPTLSGKQSSTVASTSAPYPAKAIPGWKNCIADPVVKPNTVMLDCIHESTYVKGVKWQSWTAEKAIGTGTYSTMDCSGKRCSKATTWAVTVVLSEPVTTPEGPAFSNAVTY